MKRGIQALILLVVAASPAYAGTVTPEPATVALVATGLGVIGVGAWLKRRR